MKIGILGSSDVAKFLAAGFLKEGHEVMLGSRDPGTIGVAPWTSAVRSRRFFGPETRAFIIGCNSGR